MHISLQLSSTRCMTFATRFKSPRSKLYREETKFFIPRNSVFNIKSRQYKLTKSSISGRSEDCRRRNIKNSRRDHLSCFLSKYKKGRELLIRDKTLRWAKPFIINTLKINIDQILHLYCLYRIGVTSTIHTIYEVYTWKKLL